jgi:intein-encoded DNA endonuclease-like protein
MRSTSANYRNADALADGRLDAILAGLRADGLSYASIASRLYADHGIEVSAPTVGAWLKGLEEAA